MCAYVGKQNTSSHRTEWTKLWYIKLTHLNYPFLCLLSSCTYFDYYTSQNKNTNFPNFAKLIRLRTKNTDHTRAVSFWTQFHTQRPTVHYLSLSNSEIKCCFLVNSKLLFHSLKCNKNWILSEELLQYRNNATVHLMALASLRPLRFVRAHWSY
jgi:hypothetical protein